MQLPTRIYNIEQIRELEKLAITECKIPEDELMSRAGKAAFDLLVAKWPEAKKIAVVCGGGNNGGDGYVVARLASDHGLEVEILSTVDIDSLKDPALSHAVFCRDLNIPITIIDNQLDIEADLIVDALLGIGIHGELRSDAANAINLINSSSPAVLSIDAPSGLDVERGVIANKAVNATATITFLGLKPGLLTADGPAHAGEIFHDSLQVPDVMFQQEPEFATRISLEHSKQFFKFRSRNAHKGDFGHVLIVGGDYGMPGAAKMAAEAAMRVGAGLCSVATHPEHVSAVTSSRPEIMCLGVESGDQLDHLIEKANIIVLGPGLGQSTWSEDLFQKILNTEKPLVVDADALNLLAKQHCKRDNWILTPHPGEAGRLLNLSTDEIQADRFSAITRMQAHFGGVSVLKGAGTVVLDDSAHIGICDAGNPGMASGGMGDVLSGVIGGLAAQGFLLEDAARVGVCIHSTAADLAAEQGERGLLAMDLMGHLKALVNPSDI